MSALRFGVIEAVRGLWAGRSTTLIAFFTLSLAMSAVTVTFSVVYGVALKALPYQTPERLVDISLLGRSPGLLGPASPEQYFEWKEGTQAFEMIAAARPTAPLQLELGGTSEKLTTIGVTVNLFDLLGVRPKAGRWFRPEQGQGTGSTAVILSHNFWMRRFGGDPTVIGRRLTLSGVSREVVGVLPAEVLFPVTADPRPDLYVPYAANHAERVNNRAFTLSVVGRLRPGVTVEQARADLVRVSTTGVVVQPLHDRFVGPAKKWLFLILAAVGFLLLIACVNVASLLLARGAVRSREFATRLALGASHRRLAYTLLGEGLLLGLACGTSALTLSSLGLRAVLANLPEGLPRLSEIAVDPAVITLSLIAAVLSGVIFASGPSWFASRTLHVDLLKPGGPVIGSQGLDRVLSHFLIGNIAIVAMLLVTTTLVVTTFVLVTTADLGFDRRNVMSVSFQRSLADVARADRAAVTDGLYHELLSRVRTVPGVVSAAVARNHAAPMSGGSVRYSLTIPGFGETGRDDWLETNMVTPDYFQVMGMQVYRGREFASSDRMGAPLVMIINDAAVRRFFPGRDPIGETVYFGGPTTIVGVVHGVHFDGPEQDVRPAMFTPLEQASLNRLPLATGTILVRTSREPKEVAGAVRSVMQSVLAAPPGLPQFLDDYFQRATAGRRFNAKLMATLSLFALAVGTIGIYGTMAYVVARQVRAIGLRMALGASPCRVMCSVLHHALKRVVAGTALGLLGAWAISSSMRAFVFGVQPTESVAYLAVGCGVPLVGIVAALVPAIRAARLDPLEAMRRE